jgi:hypothetical protein
MRTPSSRVSSVPGRNAGVDRLTVRKRGRKTSFEVVAASRGVPAAPASARSRSNGSSSRASQSGVGRASWLSKAT